MNSNDTIYSAMRNFASTVTEKMGQITQGEPEDQLRAPFEAFMNNAAAVFGWEVVCTGETPLPGRLGRPDFAIHKNRLLTGYAELKAPGVGVIKSVFKGHNLDQFKRFSSIPNILYSDGNEWALYRSGKRVGKVVRLSGDVAADGGKAAASQDAEALEAILQDFLLWEPIIPFSKTGKIDFKGFAELLAPLCRMLRDDVTDALKDANSPLVRLAEDWRHLLFPEASDEQFADAYAQTAAFALLLGRSEGADPLTLEDRRGRARRTAQPAFTRPASSDRSRGARRDCRFPRLAPARDRHRRRPTALGGLKARPMALLLRRLSRRLRPQAAQRRRSLLHPCRSSSRPDAPDRQPARQPT